MATENEKSGLIAQLIQLAKADNQLKESEFQFLISLAVQMGVTKDEFKQLFEETIKFQSPQFEGERILQFQRLILLMNIGVEIDESELNYIKDVGIRMGLHPSATNTVLMEMHNYENKVIPPDRLIEIFSTYHN